MFVVGSFEYNLHLELAISELEKKGIHRDAIAAVIMDSRVEERKILDTIHRADGISSFDAAALLGTFGMLLGAIYGFVLYWGPIIWGLIGLLSGAILGLLGDIFLSQIFGKKRLSSKATGTAKGTAAQVVIIVECRNDLAEMVKNILWDNLALAVGTLPG
ncbi:hypothetical protein [Candidatus Formimonas warabiya]|uniref:DUF1269 domain-containing protein n=1 Tax=Formimonas warabiya TaxID=1761012 RepID=A0A3G1KUN6_FORW1|nr:hypothetical protein [Candidatus Formimonas warabiya]ATW26156.1 hypothetical protein DCMF_16495 [Candidatus Formimonas warabiya]